MVGEYFNMVDSIDNWTVKGAFRHRMELGSATLFLNKSFQPYHMVIDINTGLPQGWAYAPSIDLELKQYTLLGYLQRIQGRFDEYKLYPYLEHIQAQVAELRQLRNDKRAWADRLHGELTGFDPSTGALIHERPLQGELLRVIDEVIAFAVPGLVPNGKPGHRFARRAGSTHVPRSRWHTTLAPCRRLALDADRR